MARDSQNVSLVDYGHGLYTSASELRVVAFDIGTRTTIAKIGEGGVMIISPGRLSDDLRRNIDALGDVRALVAPNQHHHLFLERWARQYPKAELVAAPGLARKRRDIEFHKALVDTAPALWADTFEQHVVGGMPRMGEVVFFHLASKTLVVTDLLFNFVAPSSLRLRAFATLNGVNGRLASPRFLQMVIRDRAAFRASVDRIGAWDFERVIVTHGEVVERGAREAYQTAFGWL